MNGSRPAGSAVVIGAGIGGLSAAIGLQRVGWRVIVLERAADLGEAGAGISLMSNALRALDQLGVSEALRAEGFTQPSGATRTPSGRRLARLDAEVLQRRLGIEGFILLHRAELHGLLREAVSPGTVRTGCEVVAVEPGQLPPTELPKSAT
jgi:2-polyprenyl-6-methoxyphenol hydroxylase-like FAD-dependent oxidoreductase